MLMEGNGAINAREYKKKNIGMPENAIVHLDNLRSPLESGRPAPPLHPRQSPFVLKRIIEYAIPLVFEVDVSDLHSPTRGKAEIAFARQVAMYLAHVAWGLSYTEVGRIFQRDRTTVAHACSLVEDRRDDVRIDRTLDLLEAVVGRLAHVTSIGSERLH